MEELKKYEVSVSPLDAVGESDDPAAFIHQVFSIALPEVDNRMRSKNTKEGIRRALKDGYYPYGMPPIGTQKTMEVQRHPC